MIGHYSRWVREAVTFTPPSLRVRPTSAARYFLLSGTPMFLEATCYKLGMTNDAEKTRYYVRATDPSRDEQVVFACPNLAAANAKAAELRMNHYQDVIISLDKPPEDEASAS